MSALFAGIDGGQSSTICVIGDEEGRILARGSSGPADEIGEGPGSTRLHDALAGALDDARRHGGLAPDTSYAVIVAGVSGYEGRISGRAPELPARRLRLVHDALIAHEGALAGAPGVVAIAGTGSVVYGRSAGGAERTFGGWGYLLGDEGSAFHLAREALSATMRAQDDGDASQAAASRAACEFFGALSLRELARGIYAGEIDRARIAAFAPAVHDFESLAPIAQRGAERIAALVAAAVRAGAAPSVALCGGAFSSPSYARRVRAAIEAASGAAVVEPRYDPACGALLLAYREGGIAPGELRW